MDPSDRHLQLSVRLARFAEHHGVDPAALSDRDVVEAFVTRGLLGASSSTRGTYRAVLSATPGRRARLATPFSGAPAPAPYSSSERAELFAVARAQRGVVARGALGLVSFGIGAGLRARELVSLRGRDVSAVGEAVLVRLAGRTIVVALACEGTVRELSLHAGDDFVFRPGGAIRSYKNFVNEVCDAIVADPAAARLTLSRCRSSFVCDHLAAKTPIATLLAQSGIDDAGSLLRYARHVPSAPATKAELRREARQGR